MSQRTAIPDPAAHPSPATAPAMRLLICRWRLARILTAGLLAMLAGCIAVPDKVRGELRPAEPAHNHYTPDPARKADQCTPPCQPVVE